MKNKYYTAVLFLTATIFTNQSFAENNTLMHQWHNHGSEVTLPGAFFPESIAADWDGTLYVSSIATGEIVKISAHSNTPETFVEVGVNTNSTGLLVDVWREVLWSCDVDLSMQSPSELRAFSLSSAELLASYPIPDGGLCADITLSDEGALYVTDTLLARVLKFETPSHYSPQDGDLSVWSADPVLIGSPENFLKINGIAYSRNHSIYTTNYSTGTLYRIHINHDGSPGEVEIIETDQPLSFPDGIEMVGSHHLLVTQNTGSLVKIKIKKNQGEVSVINDNLDQPTSVARVWGQVWVTEGQILRFVGADPSPLNFPFKIRRVSLH